MAPFCPVTHALPKLLGLLVKLLGLLVRPPDLDGILKALAGFRWVLLYKGVLLSPSRRAASDLDLKMCVARPLTVDHISNVFTDVDP
eukprot:3974441-Pyramimonas_sp.AAC.1